MQEERRGEGRGGEEREGEERRDEERGDEGRGGERRGRKRKLPTLYASEALELDYLDWKPECATCWLFDLSLYLSLLIYKMGMKIVPIF